MRVLLGIILALVLANAAVAQTPVLPYTQLIDTTGGTSSAPVNTCQKSVVYDAGTNGSTELVALQSGLAIYVCSYTLFSAGTVNVSLVYGTGTACVTGRTSLTPAYQFTAQTGIVDRGPVWNGIKTPQSNALCLLTSAGVPVQGLVSYSVLK